MLKKLLTTAAILGTLATTAQAQSTGPAPDWVIRKAYATFTPDAPKATYEQIKQREAWLREQGYASIVVDDTLQFWNKQQAVRIPADANGHFYPKVTIKGTTIRFMYDPGATVISLSGEDARKAGYDPQSLQFTGKSQTANGVVPRAPITLPEVTIEGIVLRDVSASCCSDMSLLGMSALKKLYIEMIDGWLSLSPKN
jgi:clan AA aspartic protease (TIGR02281 family)